MAKNPMTVDALQRMLQASLEKVKGQEPTGLKKTFADQEAKQKQRAREETLKPVTDFAGRVRDRGIGGMIKDIRDPPSGLEASYPPEYVGLTDYLDDELYIDIPQEPTGLKKTFADRDAGLLDMWARRQRQMDLDKGSLRYGLYSEWGDDPESFKYDYMGREQTPYWDKQDIGEIDWQGMYRTGRRSARDAYDKGRTEFKKEARSAYEAEVKKRKAIATGDVKYLKSLYKPEGEARKRVVSGADKIATAGVQHLRKSGAELGMAQRGGKYLGLDKGAFHGTLPQSTGALNGVMRGLAGLFILFVFISVFYMVFGPLYSVLTTNFLSIIAADGSTMLGGKDVTTLYANTANSILLWVPLLVIGGTLYLLISMVFERESKGLARTNEMLAWDALAGSDEDVNLDIALEGGFDPMGDFYGPS
jgi:hypothetical protein